MRSTFDDLRVLIVADDPLSRAGLAGLLSELPGCTLAGQLDGTANLAAEIAVYRPDVMLWDLGWEPAATLDRVEDPDELDIPILVLLPPESSVAEILAAGITGLLFRDATPDKLLAALHATAQGLATLEPELMADLSPARPPETQELVEELTPRELEVLQLLAEGMPNKTIARRLEISEHTVKFHVNAILGKLGAQSRTEAVVRATRLGLLLL